ncbi:response regulator transcription factor [Oleiagrimonas soli]|uniref:Transcriptional regulator n=1 Tax=Oleiagrimonas soli TaxID=1543381 RepID=A0A099CVV0_9GAMM|nr:response regulator transcription factor [Oleiagrimonas soli]KGI78043.1 transcriptional regulator [Oleiagrimonas soli]MBB6183560.1 two-component system copper resistance phosphate regulon response regulator CusR [Oleiagrimonas soli]
MKLLLVEDSKRLRETVQRGLQAEGFTVDVAVDGAEGLNFLRTYEYELLVLDLMMPRMDGMTVLRTLPSLQHRPKVLVLSARDQVADRVAALDVGADDYLVKPFAFDELLARLHALARRPSLAHAPVLQVGPLRIDLRAHCVVVGDRELSLTPREFALLSLLARHRGRVFSRGEILERVAGSDSTASDRSIEVLVFGLRRKLDQVAPERLIETRRGAGYLIP